jgi:hypothetical protein
MHTEIEKLPTEQIEDLGKEGLQEMIREDIQEIQGRGHRLGRCIKVMRDKLFYKPDFDTFEDYCEESLGISKRHADRLIANAVVRADVEAYVNKLIESGEVSQSLSQISLLPVIESHCDALNSVAKELRGEVWLKANAELEPNERLTAKKILDVALKCTTEKAPKTSALPPITAQSTPTVQTTIESDDQPDEYETYGGDEPETPPEQPLEPTPPEPQETPATTLPEEIPTPKRRYLTEPIGLVGKVSDYPTPARLFDFAVFQIKHLQGSGSVAMENLHRLLKEEGGIVAVVVEEFTKASKLATEAETWGLKLEQTFVLQKQQHADYLFEPDHQHILVFSRGTIGKKAVKLRDRAAAVKSALDYFPGTCWQMNITAAAEILFLAYSMPGDKVLCPAGGTEFIEAALGHGNETHYLCADLQKLEYYRETFKQ